MQHTAITLPRRILLAATTGLALAHGAAQAGVNVSVGVNQPGFYGRVIVGDHRPAVIYPQPVIIQSSPTAVVQQPIYMNVPPGHYKHWSRYCGRYSACGQPVYFVQDASSPVFVQDRGGRHRDRDDHRGDHRR
ncbi:MAG: hypothetical protein WAQ08_19145 [Aquabacterium sp.]|jgi:hypothetical protein|uniref:hypothetical protein n=1 Tax=Aquabacterium sp. TaxID=1872578 RepID=UPI003BAE9034